MLDSSKAPVDWEVSDGYEINALVATYDSNDTFFIPYMDTIETVGTDVSPGSETVQILYDTDHSTIIRARNVLDSSPTKLQSFVTTSNITSTGMNVSIIRNEDEVYST